MSFGTKLDESKVNVRIKISALWAAGGQLFGRQT
jgi:hypothetical protein